MQSIDDNVFKALQWTVDELLIGCEGWTLLLHTDFDEGKTITLYQEPTVGWITKDSEKLGNRAQALNYRIINKENRVELDIPPTHGQTAIKTALLVRQLLTNCIKFGEDTPCAQPLSLSDWDFPIISAWIDTTLLKETNIEELFTETKKRKINH